MRPLGTAWTAAAFGALAGALLAAQVLAQGASVSIASFKFAPDSVSAAPNTPITWTNKDGAPHQVVIAAKNLKTAVLNNGQSGQLRIAEAGTYNYVCGIHPSMTGKIVVK
jgi:plastocyanin